MGGGGTATKTREKKELKTKGAGAQAPTGAAAAAGRGGGGGAGTAAVWSEVLSDLELHSQICSATELLLQPTHQTKSLLTSNNPTIQNSNHIGLAPNLANTSKLLLEALVFSLLFLSLSLSLFCLLVCLYVWLLLWGPGEGRGGNGEMEGGRVG